MTINQKRLFSWNDRQPNLKGDYVLYWMQIYRRIQYNFALEEAINFANQLGKPLLIYEGLQCDYPWSCDRFHHFLMEGMHENATDLRNGGFNYHPYLESEPGEGKGLVRALSERACVLITDHFPVFIIRKHNEYLGSTFPIPYISVDSNGLIPLGISTKAPYSAYEFRRLMQKYFIEAFENPPQKNPLTKLKNRAGIKLAPDITKKWRDATPHLPDPKAFIRKLPVNHSVGRLGIQGTRKAAIKRMQSFLKNDLVEYADLHSHPDFHKTSGLSPYLHFGKVSVYDIVPAVLKKQPPKWTLETITYRRGSREGFFNGYPYVDSFLDELITWRETGYHYCHHTGNYDQFESLPEWARTTLLKHEKDKRDPKYSLDQLEQSETYDELWNSAQRQLVKEGYIHNYLRMLWGKKILEWTKDPKTALQVLIELNNKYSIDGRNPNSYTGIFWTLGRFDRPWAPERNIFGTVRYMSSGNTARKIKVKQYLKKYGPNS